VKKDIEKRREGRGGGGGGEVWRRTISVSIALRSKGKEEPLVDHTEHSKLAGNEEKRKKLYVPLDVHPSVAPVSRVALGSGHRLHTAAVGGHAINFVPDGCTLVEVEEHGQGVDSAEKHAEPEGEEESLDRFSVWAEDGLMRAGWIDRRCTYMTARLVVGRTS
jgi:hypothetical protein